MGENKLMDSHNAPKFVKPNQFPWQLNLHAKCQVHHDCKLEESTEHYDMHGDFVPMATTKK
jgi:hypothetical protein